MPSGRHRARRRQPRSRPVRPARGGRRDRQPVPGRRGRSRALERADRYAYVLCRTSNPEAAEFQNLVVAADPAIDAPAEPLHLRVARRAATWGPGWTVGLVVDATAPDELHQIRAVAPGLGFLVPGIGAQGGEIEPVLRDGPATASPAAAGSGAGDCIVPQPLVSSCPPQPD
jgi:orotidine-5'-phosphate decarboxylase